MCTLKRGSGSDGSRGREPRRAAEGDYQYTVVSDDLTPDAIRFAYKWLSLPPRFRKDVERNVDNLLETGASSYEKFLEKIESERKL